MQSHEELFGVVKQLTEFASVGADSAVEEPLEALERAAKRVSRAFSGSWLGYHARVYYGDLSVPPPGAHFSQEWGIQETFGDYTLGDWREYAEDDVLRYIEEQAGHPDLSVPVAQAQRAAEGFAAARSSSLSILESELAVRPDRFLERLKQEIEALKLIPILDFVEYFRPTGQFISRDMAAVGQGIQVPPHIRPMARVLALRQPFSACKTLADKTSQAASHMERQLRRNRAAGRVGANVFIGHGRSPLWRELKDFVGDRLGLPWDEFNRLPVAGVTNVARLAEMLDAAALALLVMTAEDEMADGGQQARMNVIHEAGLFQGRLGFSRAIVLIEDGCSEFSNIAGLGQIRFPTNNINAALEEVRRVLEREGLIEP